MTRWCPYLFVFNFHIYVPMYSEFILLFGSLFIFFVPYLCTYLFPVYHPIYFPIYVPIYSLFTLLFISLFIPYVLSYLIPGLFLFLCSC